MNKKFYALVIFKAITFVGYNKNYLKKGAAKPYYSPEFPLTHHTNKILFK